jgi:hypothetical protein
MLRNIDSNRDPTWQGCVRVHYHTDLDGRINVERSYREGGRISSEAARGSDGLNLDGEE